MVTMVTRRINIQFEVTENISDKALHEELCIILHEGGAVSDKLMNGMIDIVDYSKPKLHLHIWPEDIDKWDDGPDEEIDFDHEETYDDHEQYVGTLKNGQHLELRLMTGS